MWGRPNQAQGKTDQLELTGPTIAGGMLVVGYGPVMFIVEDRPAQGETGDEWGVADEDEPELLHEVTTKQKEMISDRLPNR